MMEPGWAQGTLSGGQCCPARSQRGPGLGAAVELLYPVCPNPCWRGIELLECGVATIPCKDGWT